MTKILLERLIGLDRRRSLPKFIGSDNFRRWFKRRKKDTVEAGLGPVILLDDCFTTFNQPEIGRSAVNLLEAAGYEVRIVGGACCGRPAVSKGLLEQGREMAQAMVDRLAPSARQGIPVVGVEPSCMTMLADDYRHLRLGDDAVAVAGAVTSVERLLIRAYEAGRLNFEPLTDSVLLHGHCQQKAVFGTADTHSALAMIQGLTVRELDSGCCGMAGSFGYDKSHYEMSRALAERVLLSSVRESPESLLLAVGTSCRAQVADLAGIEALHPLQLLERRLKSR